MTPSTSEPRYALRDGITLGAGLGLPLVVDALLATGPGAPLVGTPQLAGVAALLLVSAGALGARLPDLAGWLRLLGVLMAIVLIGPGLTTRPSLTLVILLASGALVASPILEEALRRPRRPGQPGLLPGAVGVATGLWVLAVPLGAAVLPRHWLLIVVAWAAPLALTATRSWGRGTRGGRAIACAAAAACLGLLAVGGPRAAATLLPLVFGGCVAAQRLLERRRARLAAGEEREPWWARLAADPARVMVVTFLGCGLLGGAALSLPACSSGGDLAGIDALFTAFSATCVTGLVVLDTARDFSLAGQVVILTLIQLGGLGIMTLSTAALVLLGRRISVRHERSASEVLGQEDRGSLRRALLQVLALTFGIEAAGAVLLTLLFAAQGDALPTAAWRGLFTSVSAFCNAGFGLQTNNLVPYQRAPLILHTVAALIVCGGLGPVVIASLPRLLRRRRPAAHVRVVLVTTAVLLVVPAVFLAASEASGALAHLGPVDLLTNAWFQSVTLRTAGFNSIDLNHLRPATLTAMMGLMFIGGSPGSTAGGIKTTTLAVLLLACWAALRGRRDPSVAGHALSPRTVYRALAIAVAGVATVLSVFLALELTQPVAFKAALFEAFSAVGTAGLTIGATAEVDAVGKLILIGGMLAGRVGPLTLFVLLTRDDGGARWERPVGDLPLG